jgi:hypothetical protein
MNRTSTVAILILGGLIGSVAGALTAVPTIGVSGGYALALLGGFAGFIFLIWPEVRDRSSKQSSPSTQDRTPNSGHTQAS